MLVAWSTNVAIISGFVGSALTVLVVLAAYGGRPSDGVWRISFGVGCVVSTLPIMADNSYPSLCLVSDSEWQIPSFSKSTVFVGGNSPTDSPSRDIGNLSLGECSNGIC